MKMIIVYSSVTGNTRSVAEAVHDAMPPGAMLAPVHKAPDPETFDLILLGFWVRRARPDPRMLRYMSSIKNKNVAWFGTLAAWPDSPHAMQVRNAANSFLEENRVLGGFRCQGRIEAKRFEACMNGLGAKASTHPLTEERKSRLIEAARHPDETDFASARIYFSDIITQSGIPAGTMLTQPS